MANPRRVAVNALCKVFSDNAYSNITLNTALKESDLNHQEKAFCSRIFYGVIERKITLDYFLNRVMKKTIDKTDVYTAQVLRTGLYQIMYMDSVPAFSAVDEAVKLIKKSKYSRNSGFVNAVLRNAIRQGFELPSGSGGMDLSVKYSCPIWIIDELISDYGKEITIKFLEESIKPAPLYIRVNSVKTNSDDLIKLLAIEQIEAIKTEKENCLITSGFDIEGSDCYKKGLFHIQDTASQTVCEILSPKPNESLLDLCAAPGGKTFTLAQLMQNKGRLLSCDLYEARVGLIEKGAKRLGLDIIKTRVNDAQQLSDLGEFDNVLCDVPCSGIGIIRRKPDIKYKNETQFSSLEQIQGQILNNASKYVKAGGKLLYSTCTLRKKENGEIIKDFLENNKDFSLEYEHTFFPHTDSTDGFYCALMRKK